MSETLISLNDPPYGTERSYTGLCLALALTGRWSSDPAMVTLQVATGL